MTPGRPGFPLIQQSSYDRMLDGACYMGSEGCEDRFTEVKTWDSESLPDIGNAPIWTVNLSTINKRW